MLPQKIESHRFVIALAITMVACLAQAQTPADIDAAKQVIWEKELAIYKGRSQGDLSNYLNSASDSYLGWPPGAKVPANLSGLKKMASSMSGLNQERLTMELADFTLSGNTAVIYYHTHRTSAPNGDAVDQHYAICHVWVREQTGWKLIGAHGRLKAESELRVSVVKPQ